MGNLAGEQGEFFGEFQILALRSAATDHPPRRELAGFAKDALAVHAALIRCSHGEVKSGESFRQSMHAIEAGHSPRDPTIIRTSTMHAAIKTLLWFLGLLTALLFFTHVEWPFYASAPPVICKDDIVHKVKHVNGLLDYVSSVTVGAYFVGMFGAFYCTKDVARRNRIMAILWLVFCFSCAALSACYFVKASQFEEPFEISYHRGQGTGLLMLGWLFALLVLGVFSFGRSRKSESG